MIKIAFLQIAPTGSLEGNLHKGIEYCKEAAAQGADIILFPEMWSDGYDIPVDMDELNSLAISADDEFIKAYQQLAAELDCAIAISFLEKKENDKPLNSVILFDMEGKEVLHYSKVHTCAFGEEARLSPGNDFYVSDLKLKNYTIKVGSMICFDREFPESARVMMLDGAELILVPNACPMEINRISQLRGRAFENMLAIATCNYPGGVPDSNGHSTLMDGMAYKIDGTGVRDMCLLESPEAEGVYIAELDIDELRAYRGHEVWGNKYRRPEKYGVLTGLK